MQEVDSNEKKEPGSEPSSDHLNEDPNTNRLRGLEGARAEVKDRLENFQAINHIHLMSNRGRAQWFSYLTELIRQVSKDCNKSPKEELLVIWEILSPLSILLREVKNLLKPTHKKTKEKLDHEEFTLQLIINHIESLINGYSEEDQK